MEVHYRSEIQVDAKHHVSSECIPEENFILSIKQKMETVSLCPCINRVSEEHYKDHKDKYFPELVSIGPFHHGKEELEAMEDKKWRYLNTMLSRTPNVDETLARCVKTLKCLEEKARKCYAGTINMESDKFVQVMLVDGCFIIELFLMSAVKGLKRRDDPCFSSRDRLNRLKSDLILLENQIPFFVLHQLYQLVPIPQGHNQPLTELALSFFRRLISGDREISPERIFRNVHHFLDLIRQYYLPTILEFPSKAEQELKDFKSATHLQAAGINLRKAKAESLMNIKFSNGILRIPPLKIQNHTEILFRNLIALEFYCSQYTKHITSYALLMGSLITLKNDVRMLRHRRILIVDIDKTDEILNLFKNLKPEMDMNDFFYRGLFEQISGHQTIKLQVVTLCC